MPTAQISNNTDLSDLKQLLVRVENAALKANDKKVILAYQDFEKFQNETIEVRNSFTG